MGHMVYPGANHTRFEHSIGVVKATTRLFEKLHSRNREFFCGGGFDEMQLRSIVRLGALLHDVGHSPFSHTAEGRFERPENCSTRPDGNGRFQHEHMTARIIRESDLNQLIKDSFQVDPEHVVFVATEGDVPQNVPYSPQLQVLRQIITSELGSDRCDYLVRDAYHSGQPGGKIDFDRLVDCVLLVDDRGAEHFGFFEGAAITAEQMIAERYGAYANLYFHKTKRAYELHLNKFVDAWLERGMWPTDLSEFIAISDSAVLAGIAQAAMDKSSSLHKLAAPFHHRAHYRLAFEMLPADLRNAEGAARGVTPEEVDGFRDQVQSEFDDEVLIDQLSHSATGIGEKKSRVRIQMKDGSIRWLDDLAELVGGMDRRIWRLRIYSSEDRRAAVKDYCQRNRPWRSAG